MRDLRWAKALILIQAIQARSGRIWQKHHWQKRRLKGGNSFFSYCPNAIPFPTAAFGKVWVGKVVSELGR